MVADTPPEAASMGTTVLASITIFVHVFSLAPLANKCVESHHCTRWGPPGADIGYPLAMSMLQLACVGFLMALACAFKSFMSGEESCPTEEGERRCAVFGNKAKTLVAAGAAFGIKYGLHTNAIRTVSVRTP